MEKRFKINWVEVVVAIIVCAAVIAYVVALFEAYE